MRLPVDKRKILIQLDGDPQPSVFDRVVAIDAGADELFSYGGVQPGQVQGLVHGAIFTRGPKDLKRTALFIEQSLLLSLKWVIFEPNAQPLWSAISMSINAFMLGLFKQGAFQGDTPSQAFLVQCDSQTTTQTDIDNGIVNIIVGFAPLVPAEFVVITIAQLAGQTQTS